MSNSKTIRIMTYNIHHGAGIDGKVNIDRIAKVIARENADIVALQEVDRDVKRSHRIDTMARLSELTGMAHAFGKNIEYQGGDYGNGVLTRFPILQEKNLHYRMIRPREQRGLLQLVLEVCGQEVVLMNTHIDPHPDEAERLMHAEKIRATALQYSPRPVIVCGDFNARPESKTIVLMKADFVDVWELVGVGDGKTIPVSNPKKRIDYIFLSKGSQEVLKPISADVVRSDASDHLPVIAEFHVKSHIMFYR